MFIKLTERLGFNFGFKRYDSNPQMQGVNLLSLNGNDFIDPENIDAYDIYSTTPHLWAVIQRRGDLLASGQWKHYKLVNGEKVEVDNSEIVNTLENPNPLYKGNDYLRLLNENKCVYGNVYTYQVKPYSLSNPLLLTILPSYDVRIKTFNKWFKQSNIEDIIQYYEIISSNEKLEVKDINHVWIQNSKNPLQGESPLNNLYMPISNLRLGLRFRNTLMAKKGAIGILSNESKDQAGHVAIPKDERLRIEQEFQKDYGIQEGKSSIIMASANLKWQSISFPTKDLMLFEEDENDFCQICDAYGMKRDLFASTQGATFENQKEALKQTYQSTIIPEAEEIAMNHTSMFNLDGKTEWLELDYSHIPVLQENQVEKARVNKLLTESIKTLKDAGFEDKQINELLGVNL